MLSRVYFTLYVKSKALGEPRGLKLWRYLRFFSPHPDTILHYKTTDMGLVHRVVCLFTPQLSWYSVRGTPTHGGVARLSWHGWLIKLWFRLDILPVRLRLPIPILTGRNVEQLRWSFISYTLRFYFQASLKKVFFICTYFWMHWIHVNRVCSWNNNIGTTNIILLFFLFYTQCTDSILKRFQSNCELSRNALEANRLEPLFAQLYQ